MQLAGVPCVVCDSPVPTIFQGIGCRHCQRVAHRECAPDEKCPLCGNAMVESQALNRDMPRDLVPAGIGGWLAVFVVLLPISSVVTIVTGATLILRGRTTPVALAGVIALVTGLAGGWVSRLMLGLSSSAPRRATQWLVANAVAGLLLGTLLNDLNGAGRGVISAAIWGAYLSRSRRVANTYTAPTSVADYPDGKR